MGTVIGAGIGSRIPQGMTLQKLGFEPFSETESYAVGDVVVYEGDIYKFNAAHPAGAWIGTDADKTSVAELIACGGQGLPVEHEIPEEGMLPDVRYVLDVSSTPSLDITLQPGTPGRAATYHLVFRIFDDIPSITWPEGMYGAPTLEEEMLYEIDITDDGTYIIANAYSVSVPYTANKIRYKTTDDSELEISFDGLNLKKSVFDGEYWNAQFDGVITEVKYNSINDYRLKEVILPSQLTTIGEYAFQSCEALTSVTIPDSVTTIGNSTFYGCSALTSVTIPDSVTTIGDWAFYACSALTSVTIPDSVITIGEYAFVGCEALTSVTIPDSVTTIGNSTFYGCSSLTSVTIPDSVTTIGNSTFVGCSALTSVTIPDSVTTIETQAFKSCSSLIVTIPDSVTTIGFWAFYAVPLICYNGTATGSPWGAKLFNPYVEGYFAFSDSTKTTILKYLNKTATSVTIPDSVITIGEYAFQSCSALTSIVIPDSVTSIEKSVFEDCEALTSVTIPDSVITIGEYAFVGCSALTSVTIPDSVTTIGNSTFVGCSSLTSVTIPDSVTTIGNSTFYGCSALTSVTVLATTPPTLGGNASQAFSGSYPVYVPAASVNSYKTASNWTSISSRITAIPE